MSDYPDELTREFWVAIGQLAVVVLLVVVVFAITSTASRITPEREAELKAQGAAEADRKAATAGGWAKWIAKEIGGSADGRDALRPSWEVCRD